MIQFKTALPENSADVSAIYSAARDHLNRNKILQWPPHYPSGTEAKKDIQAKELVVGWNQNRDLVGCFSLNLVQDDQYAGVGWKYGHDGIPAVLHRFVIDPKFQGKGYGAKFMAEVERRAVLIHATSIRLDTFLGNKASNSVYLKAGYQLAAGCCFFHGREIPFLCYEKNLVSKDLDPYRE